MPALEFSRSPAVLLDFGGTLDSDGVPWLDRFLPLYRRYGLDAPDPVLTRAFYDIDDHLAVRHALSGLGLAETLRLHAADAVERFDPRRAGAARGIHGDFLAGCRDSFRRNRPILDRLRRHFRLGVVSNFYGNLESVLASEGLRGYFDAVADSGVLGVSKPDAGIFLHVTRALGVEARDCVMVGDSLKRDMRGAEALGMRHLWLSPTAAAPCCPRGTVVRTFAEIEALLLEAASA